MDWITIIGSLLGPLLAKCFNQQSSENPKDYLAEHYDATTEKMDASLVRSAIPATRRAIRKAYHNATPAERHDFPRYSKSEIYDIAEKKLIEGMNADESTLIGVFAAAASLPDED